MKANETENRFETGFQHPKTDLPKNGISILVMNQWINGFAAGNCCQCSSESL